MGAGQHEVFRNQEKFLRNHLPCSRCFLNSTRLWNVSDATWGLPHLSDPSSTSSSNLIQRAFSFHCNSCPSSLNNSSNSTKTYKGILSMFSLYLFYLIFVLLFHFCSAFFFFWFCFWKAHTSFCELLQSVYVQGHIG